MNIDTRNDRLSDPRVSILNRPKDRFDKSLDKPYLKAFKYGVWIYFYLLIFEGALRKWVLPQLATPLLIVRDPIAIWLLIAGWNRGLLAKNIYVIVIVLIGVISFFTTIFLGHGNVAVALYGARILIVHFPLMFIIGKVFNREDTVRMGKVLLWISIPMAILIGIQFYSPQSAWVNRGIGGDMSGGGFSGALGYFRPPGTFSFTNGVSAFFGLVSFFLFYFFISPHNINRMLLFLSSFALIASVPLSISRTLFFSIGIAVLFVLVSVYRNPKFFGRIFGSVFVILIVLFTLTKTSFFSTATEAFTDRLTKADETEGGLQNALSDRYFGGMISGISNSSQLPFFGLGLGMGTNAGAKILTGKSIFLISEGEWGRLIGEMGLLLGLIIILERVVFSMEIIVRAFGKLSRKGEALPWMLLGFALTVIPQGQWAQPTMLGFSSLVGGLILAALKEQSIISKKINYL